jgi:hypothetical protein
VNLIMPNVRQRHPRPVQRVWAGLAIMAVLSTGCTGRSEQRDHSVRDSSAPPPVAIPEDLSSTELSTSLRDVVASGALVGRRVRVRGRCLSTQREGKPPRARDAWQLSADGVLVYVSGPLPAGCRASPAAMVTIVAVVAEDTLPPIGDLPPAPRRFLVYDREPDQ